MGSAFKGDKFQARERPQLRLLVNGVQHRVAKKMQKCCRCPLQRTHRERSLSLFWGWLWPSTCKICQELLTDPFLGFLLGSLKRHFELHGFVYAEDEIAGVLHSPGYVWHGKLPGGGY
jgi:hypothetical protein